MVISSAPHACVHKTGRLISQVYITVKYWLKIGLVNVLQITPAFLPDILALRFRRLLAQLTKIRHTSLPQCEI